MPQTCLSSESHTHNCSLTALICKVTALILTGGVCLGKVSGVPGHFFKAPAVLPHCGIMIYFSITSPRKSLFSFCSLYLRFLLEEKIGTDQTRSDQTVGLPSVDMSNSVPVVKLTIFPKRIHCIDMSNSLPVVKLSARPRNSQEPLNQMWCVESFLLVGYFNFLYLLNWIHLHRVVWWINLLILLSFDTLGGGGHPLGHHRGIAGCSLLVLLQG